MLRGIRAALCRSKTTTGQTPGSAPVRLIEVDPAIQKKRATPSWITRWAYKPDRKEIDFGKVISTQQTTGWEIGFGSVLNYLTGIRWLFCTGAYGA